MPRYAGKKQPHADHEMKLLQKLLLFGDDLLQLCREHGFPAAFKLIREKIYDRPETLLYEYRATGTKHELPEGWSVKIVNSEKDPAVEYLRQSGGDLNLQNFRHEAVAYVLCIGDEGVGHRWHFVNHALARRLGADVAYFGNAFVRPDWRGKRISGHLLKYMASQLPAGSRAVMEVALSNVTNQKSLLKAGCLLVGRLHTVVLFANFLRLRITPMTPDELHDQIDLHL